MVKLRLACIVSLLGLVLLACGQKGPLTLPQPEQPAKTPQSSSAPQE